MTGWKSEDAGRSGEWEVNITGQKEIYEVLRERGPMTCSQIAEVLGQDFRPVNQALVKLRLWGEVESVKLEDTNSKVWKVV